MMATRPPPTSFFAYDVDVGSFDHGVSGSESSNITFGFDHSDSL